MKNKILKILDASQDYISGEDISDKCGISRTAIWKHINTLKEEGYQIDSQPRVGYKLLKRPDALLDIEILTGLDTIKWGKEELYTFEEIDSTNIYAKKLASTGKPEGTVVVAEEQTLGKGRLGRKWESPRGKGIWLSFILRPPILPAQAPKITFVVAVGMVRALKKALNIEAKIKWPNDILINKKKVCGILTEISAEIERINYIVVGIGVNAQQNIEDFPPEFRDKATSLKIASSQKVSRVKILQCILEEMEYTYNFYLNKGFAGIINLWREYSITLGEEIKVITHEEEIFGTAIDVADDCCLLVKDESGRIHKIIAGDVSLRKANGEYA